MEANGRIVDQIRVVVDLKGASLKQLTNKNFNAIFRALIGDLSRQFPEIVNSAIVLNAPMMFESHYLKEIKP
jgi:ABC-type phosphate transport system substrate-binding protein